MMQGRASPSPRGDEMRVGIATDQGGLCLKEELERHLRRLGKVTSLESP